MSWRVRALSVRQIDGVSLRWELEARAAGGTIAPVTADSHLNGRVYDLNSGPYVGWTGDGELDHEVLQHLRDVVALRDTLKQLDVIDRERERHRWAA